MEDEIELEIRRLQMSVNLGPGWGVDKTVTDCLRRLHNLRAVRPTEFSPERVEQIEACRKQWEAAYNAEQTQPLEGQNRKIREGLSRIQFKLGATLILAGIICFAGLLLFGRLFHAKPEREPTENEKRVEEEKRKVEEQNKTAKVYNEVLDQTALSLAVGMGFGFVLLGALVITRPIHRDFSPPRKWPSTRPAWFLLSIFLIGWGGIRFFIGLFELSRF